MELVTIRLRSLADPAIQALLMTNGSFAIGLDPDLKLKLSACGVAVFTVILVCMAWHIWMKLKRTIATEDERRQKRARREWGQYLSQVKRQASSDGEENETVESL